MAVIASSPRRRGSRRVNYSIRRVYWVPAFAGKTEKESAFLLKTKRKEGLWVLLEIFFAREGQGENTLLLSAVLSLQARSVIPNAPLCHSERM
jgi:hypothetical protein